MLLANDGYVTVRVCSVPAADDEELLPIERDAKKLKKKQGKQKSVHVLYFATQAVVEINDKGKYTTY